MGKQLKKYFAAGLQLKGINNNSLLGRVFLLQSVGSESGLYLGATNRMQTERDNVRGMGAVIVSAQFSQQDF